MKRWILIIIFIALSVTFMIVGKEMGNVPETQHNGAVLCLECIGIG